MIRITVISLLVVFSGYGCYSQDKSAPWDSLLQSNSDKWELKQGRKLFGDIKKMEFGPFNLLSVEKLDSPVIRKKIKGGRETQLLLGSEAQEENGKGAFLDFTKEVTIEKTKYYRVLCTANMDTVEAMLSVLSGRTEQRRTLLGTMLNGSSDNGQEVVASAVHKQGYIITDGDAMLWNFAYRSASGNGHTDSSGKVSKPLLTGYLKNETDSFYIKPVETFSVLEYKVFKKVHRDTLYHTLGMALINKGGEQVAAQLYPGNPPLFPGDKKPFIWMRKDLNASIRQAIAAYYTVLIAL